MSPQTNTIPDEIMRAAWDAAGHVYSPDDSASAHSYVRDIIAKAIHDAVMAERERGHWQPIATAPRDGTPILIQREQAEWPFIGYWANPYRYVKQGRGAWIGHEGGLHEDADGLMWQPLPAAPKSEG